MIIAVLDIQTDTKGEPMEPIDRMDAIRIVDSIDTWQAGWRGNAIESLKAMPSVQPEIIRCKDCRWRKDQSGSIAWLPCRAIVTPSDFYCGRAERRTDVPD